MPLTEDQLRTAYPALFAPTRWGNVTLTGFHLHATWPDIALVQSVNVVPFIEDRVVVATTRDGYLILPGGTRELGETLEETGRRELHEETGATFLTCTPFAYWDCFSADAKPWRPFLSHPNFTRAVAWSEVELIGDPTSPEGAEQIDAVHVLTLGEAIDRFRSGNRPELADIYQLAAEIRNLPVG